MTTTARLPARPAMPSPLIRFLRARLERRDEDGFWLALALLLGLTASIAYLAKAWFVPIGVQDDARMFLSWMGRFADPNHLSGDLVADYWQSVSPPFYRGLFRLAWRLGIEPNAFARLLPPLLFPLCALFSFRFLRSIGAEPFIAFVTTGVLLFAIAHDGTVASATPRALRPVMFLMLIDGLSRRLVWQSALAQLILAASYPQLALVSSTVIGLTLLKPDRPFLRLDARSLMLVGLCALATIAGILPFLLESDRFRPIVSLVEAREIATFGPDGRNRIFERDGSLDLLCGFRLGIFADNCRGTGDPKLYLMVLVTLAGPLLLAWRRLRPSAKPQMRSGLPLLFVLAGLAWFALAALILFRLHLPSRYSSVFLDIAILTTLPLVIERIRDRPFPEWLVTGAKGRRLLVGGSIGGLLLLTGLAASVPTTIRSPKDEALSAAIAALPEGSVTAGFVKDLDFSPVLTGRPVLFNRELTIGYQLGFLRPILQRMEDMRDILLTNDPAILADRLERNHVRLLLVQPALLADPKVPDDFRGFFHAEILARTEAESRGKGATALARLASSCARRRFTEADGFDASCLIAAAKGGGS